MAKLMKCNACQTYTLKEQCTKCDEQTISAHYEYKELPVQLSRRR